MTVKIFDTPEVQDFIKTVAGFDQTGGNDRAKQIVHRLVGDLFKLIDDFDVTEEEYWAGVNLLNALGSQTQFGLLSPGLGFDHFLDMRQDAIDAEAHRIGGTPRTIEGPLYVAGAPEADGFARLDDGQDNDGETMWLTGQVRDVDGTPIAGAKVEIWHANSKGGYSFFDPSQSEYNLRRTIYADSDGRYTARSIIPSGYGVPEGAPTEDPAEIAKRDLEGPFSHVVFDVELAQTDAAELQVRHARPRAKEDEQDLASQLAGTAKV